MTYYEKSQKETMIMFLKYPGINNEVLIALNDKQKKWRIEY